MTVDVWYQNGLPVPRFLQNANNIKAAIGIVFLLFVARIIWIITVRAPVFSKSTAQRYFDAVFYYIHQGEADKMTALAEELTKTIDKILDAASHPDAADRATPAHCMIAKRLILTLADSRFCSVVAARCPGFFIHLISYIQEKDLYNVPIFQFARNIGNAFIRDTGSAFYQEDGYYWTGLFGHAQPITRTLFGNYKFVEHCAAAGGSPLDIEPWQRGGLTSEQWHGYTRAALAFFRARTQSKDLQAKQHSFALYRIRTTFEHCFLPDGDFTQLNVSSEFAKFKCSVDFVSSAIHILEKEGKRSRVLRRHDAGEEDDFDHLAAIAFANILNSTNVRQDPSTTWSVLHNLAWSNTFRHSNTHQARDVAFKLRRLLYNELKDLDRYAHFGRARILGYCLLVFGFKASPVERDVLFEPIRRLAVRLAVRHYERIRKHQPRVAQAVLMGPLSYDPDGLRFVRTYEGQLGTEPDRAYLSVTPYDPSAASDR
ncbi:MAG: hypothetical protein K2X45_16320 [Phreatobacter sp.]|nr:hypothetical protein [Phreatobacter sp.]